MPSLRELRHWYTSRQAASALGVSRQRVQQLCEAKQLKAAHVGEAHPGRTFWAISPESVEERLRQQEDSE